MPILSHHPHLHRRLRGAPIPLPITRQFSSSFPLIHRDISPASDPISSNIRQRLASAAHANSTTTSASSHSTSPPSPVAIAGFSFAGLVLFTVSVIFIVRGMRKFVAIKRPRRTKQKKLTISSVKDSLWGGRERGSLFSDKADDPTAEKFTYTKREMYKTYGAYVQRQGGLSPTHFSRTNITPSINFPVRARTRDAYPSSPTTPTTPVSPLYASNSGIVHDYGGSVKTSRGVMNGPLDVGTLSPNLSEIPPRPPFHKDISTDTAHPATFSISSYYF